MPDPKDTWIYYQALVTFGTLTIAFANCVSAYFVVKFVREAIPMIKNIDRSTRVLKTDTLLKKSAEAKSSAERRRLINSALSGGAKSEGKEAGSGP